MKARKKNDCTPSGLAAPTSDKKKDDFHFFDQMQFLMIS